MLNFTQYEDKYFMWFLSSRKKFIETNVENDPKILNMKTIKKLTIREIDHNN